MTLFRLVCAALLAAVLPSAVRAASPPTVTYGAPAGNLPAGHLAGQSSPYDAVLPSGRTIAPVGRSTVVGMAAEGVALSPDGRFAIVTNAAAAGARLQSALDPHVSGGSSLTVVDVSAMTVAGQYAAPNESFFAGIVALRDPQDQTRTLVLASGGPAHAVYAFTLDANGTLAPDRTHVIPIPPARDPAYADNGRSFPATLAVTNDGRWAYVVDALGDAVAGIDVAARKVLGTPRGVGFFPAGLAIAGQRLLVTNEGLLRYGVRSAAATAPTFGNPPGDLDRASSLSLVDLAADGSPTPAGVVAMDPTPDGLRTVGGAHPSAIVTTPNGSHAFVAMANVDRIATVELGAAPRVIGGVELRLFDRGPYGTQPSALAISRDGSRLYVALRGLNAVAVIDAHDPAHLRRLGLLPTGWAPSALALAPDDRTLFVANADGLGHDAGYNPDPQRPAGRTAWATLQRIDLGDVKLVDATRATLAATRRVFSSAPKYPKAIRNVVLIVAPPQTFDEALGDASAGITPNAHALAARFAVAGNCFADAEDAAGGAQMIGAGVVTPYTQRAAATGAGRAPFVNQNPEDAPRAGYLFHALARHAIGFRDYGALVHVAGYDPGSGRYSLDVPAPAVLADRVDLAYPGADPAAQFIRDYGALPSPPRFTEIVLPAGDPAAADRALGAIVAYLTHRPAWRSTAIVVAPDAAGGPDHVDVHRTYALVISPYAKRRFVGLRHTSTASVLKTIDGIFGLPALSLGDLLATDLSDLFTTAPDPRPYDAAPGGSERGGEPTSP